MTTLSSLQTQVRQAIGNSTYDATLIAGHLNQGVRLVAGRVRLPGLAIERPVVISHPSGACTAGFTNALPIPIYSLAHGLVSGDMVMPTGIVGTTELNSKQYRVTKVDADNFTLDNTTYNAVEPNYTAWASAAISAIDLTGSDVAVTTSAAHGLSTGSRAYFKQIDGTTELDGKAYTVTVTSTTAFTLDNTTPANYTAYAPAAGDNKVYSAALFYTSYVDLPSDFDYYRIDNLLRVYSVGQDASFEYRGSPSGGHSWGASGGASSHGTIFDSWEMFTRFYPVMNETGDILCLCIRGQKLYFHPMPSSDTLILYYNRVPTDMSGATDTPDGLPAHFHDCLVDYAAAEIFEEQGQLELARYRQMKWEDDLKVLEHRFLEPEDVGVRYVMNEGGFYAGDY